MQGIYLLLGTNLGDKEEYLRQAKMYLLSKNIMIKKTSSVYKTEAWGIENQPPFLNQVVEVGTTLSPEHLLTVINQIEQTMGRVRYQKWGERAIDIDILYYHDRIIDHADLKIPHPEIQNRRFALGPMAEVASTEIHPVLLKSQLQLLKACKDRLTVQAV